MDDAEAVRLRHSVRSYTDEPIPKDIREILDRETERINSETGLCFRNVYDDPEIFDNWKAHYGKFSNVRNYIVLAGPKDRTRDVGYHGEHLVILAQKLGLNTCWVALTFNGKKCRKTVPDGLKLHCVLALGYGATQGVQHLTKKPESKCSAGPDAPEWFGKGMESALLAPTAVNQQRFVIGYRDGKVTIRNRGGICSDIDLGIVMHDFEIGAGKENVEWIVEE